MKWWDQMLWPLFYYCWVKPAFSFSSIILIKRLFRFSSLSVMRVVSFKYLRFLIFLLAILIPACDSSSLEFHMVYSAYKLNKQGDNIQHSHTPFPILNQSVVPRLGLTVISWPAHRFLVSQETGIPISWRTFQFVVIHTVKSFRHSQWSRSRWFSGTPLLFLQYNECWQLNLWFLCLF